MHCNVHCYCHFDSMQYCTFTRSLGWGKNMAETSLAWFCCLFLDLISWSYILNTSSEKQVYHVNITKRYHSKINMMQSNESQERNMHLAWIYWNCSCPCNCVHCMKQTEMCLHFRCQIPYFFSNCWSAVGGWQLYLLIFGVIPLGVI